MCEPLTLRSLSPIDANLQGVPEGVNPGASMECHAVQQMLFALLVCHLCLPCIVPSCLHVRCLQPSDKLLNLRCAGLLRFSGNLHQCTVLQSCTLHRTLHRALPEIAAFPVFREDHLTGSYPVRLRGLQSFSGAPHGHCQCLELG